MKIASIPFTAQLFLCLFFFLLPTASFGQTGLADENVAKINIATQNVSLKDVVYELKEKFDVELVGLYNRGEESVDFISKSNEIKGFVKELLDYLNVKNYMFAFADKEGKKINRVWIVNESSSPVASNADPTVETEEPSKDKIKHEKNPKSPSKGRKISIVKVVGIVEDSQASSLGIKTGDIVVSYDGYPIMETRQLLNLVKARATNSNIPVVIVRDCSPINVIVDGGLIGIRIQTERITEDQIECFSDISQE